MCGGKMKKSTAVGV